jgi:hypothetical protein
VVGYAVAINNPIIREERLIDRLIEDAKRMAGYRKFRHIMRIKEKMRELKPQFIKIDISIVHARLV